MAITFAAIWSTPYASAFIATHDGAGGDTANITNANLVNNSVAGTPIRDAIATPLANQAAAQAFTGVVAATTDAAAVCRIEVDCSSAAGSTCAWGVNADVAANLLILTVTAIGAGTATVVLRRRHSIGR